jgi:hypothetical protein
MGMHRSLTTAFYQSKAWTDLASERDKFEKVIRRYAVEVEK